MKRAVIEQYEEMRSCLKTILQENKSKFSFTIDAWSAPNTKSFYGLTTHFIDKEWILQTVALDFIPSNAKHTGLNIAKFFLESTKEFKVKYFVQNTISHNMSNVGKDRFQFDVVFCHNII